MSKHIKTNSPPKDNNGDFQKPYQSNDKLKQLSMQAVPNKQISCKSSTNKQEKKSEYEGGEERKSVSSRYVDPPSSGN